MNKKWKATFQMWSATERFRQKVEEAAVIIKKALKQYEKPYVAFSGGKDSTCVLSLVLEQKKDVMVFHWDYGKYMPYWVEYEVRKNAKKIGARDIRIGTSRRYKDEHYKGPVWYKVFFGAIVPALLNDGFDSVFVGLRMEESAGRKNRIQNDVSLTRMKEFFPIYNWTWMDVWAYIVSRNLPYSVIYDMYAKVEGWDKVRFSTFFDPEMDKFGRSNVDGVLLWKFKHRRE